MKLIRFLKRKFNELDNIPEDKRNENITEKSIPKTELNNENMDRTNWTGENFEFLITGDVEILDSDFDRVMTPNSFEYEKINKNNWIYFKVDDDEFSFSWEIPGIQFTFMIFLQNLVEKVKPLV